MQKLALHYNELLKGSFELKKLNFLFVFQVNCPGCFLYGIPLVNKLYKEFNKDISFLGLSTAFEDFNYNTTENTRLLIEKNEVVGHTKKALQQEGLDTYPFSVDFPIAMDKKIENDADIKNAVHHVCSINPNYDSFSDSDKSLFKDHVANYLNNLEVISMTFTLNQLKGTPSMILFNDNHEILYHKFGHDSIENIQKTLNLHNNK